MIYTPGNFLGAVFLDGVRIKKVFYADDETGVVKYYPEPMVVDRKLEEIVSAEISGKVCVFGVMRGTMELIDTTNGTLSCSNH